MSLLFFTIQANQAHLIYSCIRHIYQLRIYSARFKIVGLYYDLSPDIVESILRYLQIWYIMVICNLDIKNLCYRLLACYKMYSYIIHCE
jgi:hypothetical protein